MDKLVKHAIRMLEIVEGENDFYRNDAKRQADIARAVYDTILRVQALERKADRKTEPFDKDINVRSKDEPQTCDDCIWSVCNYNKVFEDEPQTERSE